MTGKKIAWIVGGVVAAAGLFAALSAESGTVKDYGRVTVTGTALPRFEPDVTDSAAGMPAPTIQGESVSVVPGGTPQIVLFVAHWCPACQQEVPALTSWVEANGVPVEVELVTVATSTDPAKGNFPPSIWLEREEFPFPIIYDDEDDTAGMAYGVSAFPFWVVLDSNGNVVQRFSGVLPDQAISSLFTTAAGL
ncbi:MAG: TlpA family protein disulfide reductase [Acidimicrobiia bacterium]